MLFIGDRGKEKRAAAENRNAEDLNREARRIFGLRRKTNFEWETKAMQSILIKDTTREERIRIVHQALWGACGVDCEFCSGCDNRGGGRVESIYQPYIDGVKEIREINEEYSAPFVRG